MYKEVVAELRTTNAEIEEYRKNNPSGSQMDAQIIDVIRMMARLAVLYEKKGLPSLVNEISKLENHWPCTYVWKLLVKLVVDGVNSEIVNEIAVSKYYALDLHAYDALAVLLYMEFVKCLQMNVKPCVFEELILALVPKHIEEAYRMLAEKEKQKN